MTIRKKILIFSALALGVFLAAVYLVSRFALLTSFTRLESESARDNIRALQHALENEDAQLEIVTRDYAQWDRTYRFMKDRNPDFPRMEMSEQSLRILNVDFCALLDENGNLVFARGVLASPLNEGDIRDIVAIREHAGKQPNLDAILELRGHVYLVGYQQIVPTSGSGPARGSMLMGRGIDEDMVLSLSRSAGVPLWVEPADRLTAQKSDAQAWSDGRNFARFESDSTLLEYLALPEVSGKTRHFLAGRVPRTLYQEGKTETKYLFSLLMLAGVVYCGALFMFIEEILVGRTARLSAEVGRITVSGDLSLRLNSEGRDELSALARSVNTMLSAIQKTKAELLQAQESLRFHAEHDALTGVLNRRAIRDVLRKELARCRRERTTLGVLLADVDHFKKINDHYGHGAGDSVLVTTVQRIAQTLRSYDAVGRYGGEEFLIIAPGCDLALANKLAERIRTAVCEEEIDLGDESAVVTLSLGVTLGTPESDPEFLVEQADNAMYQAKSNGRNRVEVLLENDAPQFVNASRS